jgi:rhomboid family GlyGly-CTERM serine protease
MDAGSRAWVGLAVLLCALAGGVALVGTLTSHGIAPTTIDWQPGLALHQPWRAFSAAALHYSPRHLGANLLGCVLVAALGVTAQVPRPMAWAWFVAWPLTQFGLLLQPALLHFGGLSGVLHAGVAVAATHLLLAATGRRRALGAAVLIGAGIKVVSEAPWGEPLRHLPEWDIAVAPLAHASGLVAGVLCALLARRIHSLRRPPLA